MTHVGCPHMCAFCNQHTITGNSQIPHAQDVMRICSEALDQIKDPENTEIAFFGGSFTAVPREYMIELLEAANAYLGEGKFSGIRISTRPDYIDDEVLDILKRYGVLLKKLPRKISDRLSVPSLTLKQSIFLLSEVLQPLLRFWDIIIR